MTGADTAAGQLRAMHRGPRPLILPNVWDAASARAYAEAGFPALASSSGAIAVSLGYTDGHTPAEEMLAAVARIARSVDVPVTADIENGYGLAPEDLAGRLLEAGLCGCNLEDSDPATRRLIDPARQADFLAAVRAASGSELVINARVDVFVRRVPAGGPEGSSPRAGEAPADEGPAADAAVARAQAYLAAGADCTYPILAPPEVLPDLVSRISGPVNAMYRPGGPSLAQLAEIGVARISFGTGLHTRAVESVRQMAAGLAAEANQSQRNGSESTP